MSAQLVLRCDGRADDRPCPARNTYTDDSDRLADPGDVRQLRHDAALHGWTRDARADVCLACRRPAPATDPARCQTCGHPEDAHPYRHPFRRLTLGRRLPLETR